jgi:hypothetical protein
MQKRCECRLLEALSSAEPCPGCVRYMRSLRCPNLYDRAPTMGLYSKHAHALDCMGKKLPQALMGVGSYPRPSTKPMHTHNDIKDSKLVCY